MGQGNGREASTLRIQAALSAAADQRLLERTLETEDILVEAISSADAMDANADLLIIDARMLQAGQTVIRDIRTNVYPVVVPVLLLARRNEASRDWIQKELGEGVDDILHLPTTAAELQARVRNLLRLRTLSQTQATEHQKTRQALDGVSRALHALHACNEIMLWHNTEDALIESVCQIITQTEGYALAWVGFTDRENGEAVIDKRAVAGTASGFAAAIDVRADSTPKGNGPGGMALKTGRTQIISDMNTEPVLAPWREQIATWELGAMITIPLNPSRGPAGILVVYSWQAGDFDDAERLLLERLAENVGFSIGSLRMQREQDAQTAEIRRLAYNDTLTKLPNRRSLLEQLQKVVARGDDEQIAAILFVDLNDFKLINDALGHAAGDDVLRSTARRIQNTLRSTDMVARQGGDEFIVVMVDDPRHPPPENETAEARLERCARSLAWRVIETLREPFDVHGYSHRLNASIGISLLPYHGDDAETVIDQADMAMYFAKKSSQRIALYSPDLGSDRRQRLSLEARLHHALETEQFRLHYQPLWDLETGAIVAVEALLRWQEADGTMISPGTFIPVAEEIGLLDPIGTWVINTAAGQLNAWKAMGIELTMGVNLSASQLTGEYSAEAIRDQVISLGSDPRWWVLELTEDTLMRSPDDAAAAMSVLSQAGFRLALDDFGRGYSSLARLQTLPLDTLKVDKLFVDGLRGDAVGGRVIRGVIELARQLSLKVVAEGIEVADQERQLAAMQCNLGQGFLVSPALPAAEIPELVRSRKPEAG